MRRFTVLLLASIAVTTAMAKPAMRGFREMVQPDGSTVKVQVIGDEHLHFTVSEEGLLLARDADGFFRLGKLADDGSVVSTGLDIESPEAKESGTRITDINRNEIMARRSISSRRYSSSLLKAPQTGMGLCTSTYPVVGSPKGLIILVEYSDVKFNKNYDAKTYFNQMINGKNFTMYGGTGSALEYFTEQSGGKFTPSFDVLGPVTLPKKQSYYGANDRYGNDQHPEEMVTDAIDILNPTVDFSQYDTDKDGLIDNVYIIYAGQGEASYGGDDTVWPHSWDVRESGKMKYADGVLVGHYACSNELESSTPDGIGTFVHEFSHVMGLPDLYHTTSSSADYTPTMYSVLDYGPYNNNGRTPPNYGAYEKNALGWYEPIMLDGDLSVTLQPISSGQFGLIPTKKDTEFFLLENRQLSGWDKYIPGHGLLIWHIDYNKEVFDANIVNNSERHQYVDIVEANEKTSYKFADGFTFPGTTGKTSFTSKTSPALKSWAGEAIDHPIDFIAEYNGVITFDVGDGSNSIQAPSPFVAGWSESNGYFVAQWEPVGGATDYFVSVYGGESGAAGEITNGFDKKNLPTGWTASATGWYDTSSNYGNSAPSYAFKTDGQSLTSPEVDGDVNKIEFWAKGQGTNGTTLTIEGLANNRWNTIKTYTPLKDKAENVSIASDIPDGVRQVRFTMNKKSGNVAIDDIVIAFSGGAEPLPGFGNVSTKGATSLKVDKLIDGVSDYYFVVAATNGQRTKTSDQVRVTVKGENLPTGIGSVESDDAEPVYFNLQGVRIQNPERGSIVIMKKGDKISKVIF